MKKVLKFPVPRKVGIVLSRCMTLFHRISYQLHNPTYVMHFFDQNGQDV